MANYPNYKSQIPHQKKGKKGNFFSKLIRKLVFKIVLSPILIFGFGYIYFDGDVRKSILLALLAYTGITAIAILARFIGLFTSLAGLNLFKFFKRSFDLVIMSFTLVVYWLVYSIYYGANFSF